MSDDNPAPLLPSQQASVIHRLPGALQHAGTESNSVAHLSPLEQLREKIPKKNRTGCRLLFASLPQQCDRTALTKLIHRTLKESHLMLFKHSSHSHSAEWSAKDALVALVEECYVNSEARFAFVTLVR